jgi:hypothetical protein
LSLSRHVRRWNIKSSARRRRLRRFPQLKDSLLPGSHLVMSSHRKVDFLTSLYTNFPPCSLRARRLLDKCCARERKKEAHHNLSALSHAGFYIIPAFFPDSESSPLFIRLHGAVPRINYVEQQCLSSEEKTRERRNSYI